MPGEPWTAQLRGNSACARVVKACVANVKKFGPLTLLLTLSVTAACSVSAPPLGSPPGTGSYPPTQPPPSTTSQTPLCDASQFVVRLGTDKAAYTSGQTVHITLSITNTGRPCSGFEGSGPCFDAAEATNGSGNVVWAANLGPYACPALIVRSLPSGWNDSDQLNWAQDECPSLGTQCTHSQVLPGNYSIIGSWYVAGLDEPSRSQAETITIT